MYLTTLLSIGESEHSLESIVLLMQRRSQHQSMSREEKLPKHNDCESCVAGVLGALAQRRHSAAQAGSIHRQGGCSGPDGAVHTNSYHHDS